jgi:CRISPR/Cas system-associated exonuclease Cas4 (RecB family)
LNNNFQFNQANLQDYQTCARRFKLRYLDLLRWPAVESEPIQEAERLAKLGTDFHHLVHQHLDYQQLQIDEFDVEAVLSKTLQDSTLRDWWQNYLQYHPMLIGAKIYPEITFSTPLRGYRLVARFDVLVVQPDGQFLIIDWKTSQKKPRRERLMERIQTYVYPYVLATAGRAFNQEQSINPATIAMLYWYPAAPDMPEQFSYNTELFQRNETFLSDLIVRIEQAVKQDEFPLVHDTRPCQYCVYRSLCDRGDKAGPLIDMEEDVEDMLDISTFDWEQIAEVQF